LEGRLNRYDVVECRSPGDGYGVGDGGGGGDVEMGYRAEAANAGGQDGVGE